MRKTSCFRFLTQTACAGLATLAASASAVANNVQARLEGSLLVVEGDAVANDLVIAQAANNDIVLRGRNGTQVNGRASVRFPRVALNAVQIRMGAGNDLLTLNGLSPANDLYVNLGSGNDRLVSSNTATVGANMAVEGEAGTDTVQLSNLVVFEDLYIDGGIGASTVSLTNIGGGKGITVITDLLNDRVTLTNSTAADSVSIETKSGNDRVIVSGTSALSLAVATDEGVDFVSIAEFVAEQDIGVFTGKQDDDVLLVDVISGKSLTVSVDVGADYVLGDNVIVAEDAVFEGGDGNDLIRDLGISGGQKKEIKEFESVLLR